MGIETLLFVFGLQRDAFVASPPTPCSKALCAAETAQKLVLDEQRAKEEEIAQLKNDLEEGKIKKMQIANQRLRLKRLEEETAQGTDASQWFKAQIEANQKLSASAKWKK